MGAVTIECASCGETGPEGAIWCEACGHELGLEPRPACVSCGEREVDGAEGYCLSCGYRQPRERDHLITNDGPLVAISDRGRRHHHNEDAVAIGRADAAGGAALVIVVCDGVSSTPGSAEASAAAAVAARDHLVAGLVADPDPEPSELLGRAAAAAQEAASSSPEPDGSPSPDGPPSSTLVAVVVRPSPSATGRPAGADHPAATDGPAGADNPAATDGPVGVGQPAAADEGTVVELTTAWVGDSRAYWVGDDGPRRLTGADHEVGGSLTRWLGADSADPTPDIETMTTTAPGYLVVCTDGLWRYAAEPGELSALLERLTSSGRTGSALAEAMVDHANEQGGHDNITVALWSNHPQWPDDDSTRPSAPIASAASRGPDDQASRPIEPDDRPHEVNR